MINKYFCHQQMRDKRINKEILKGEPTGYGEQIVSALGRQLEMAP